MLQAFKPSTSYDANVYAGRLSRIPRILSCFSGKWSYRRRYFAGGLIRLPTLCVKATADHRADREQSHEASAQKVASLQSLEDITMRNLRNDPAMAAKIARLEAAEQKVISLQNTQAQLESELQKAAEVEREKQAQLQEQMQAQVQAAEVQAAVMRLQAAQLQAKAAKDELQRWSAALDQELQREESLKAGGLAAFAGLASGVPLLLVSDLQPLSQFLVALSIAVSCLLFGVTYRYAIRKDLENTDLKGGVVAAFGLARALGAGDIIQTQALKGSGSLLDADVLGPGLLYAGESMLLFGFSALCIDIGFKQGLLKPYGETLPVEGEEGEQ